MKQTSLPNLTFLKKLTLALAFLAAMGLTASSQAQTIIWGSAQSITDQSNLVDATTVPGATEFDAMLTGHGTETIDGVTFYGPAFTNSGATATDDTSGGPGDISYAESGSINTYAYTGGDSAVNPASDSGITYAALLADDFEWFGDGTVTISGLSSGKSYAVQVFSYGAFSEYGPSLIDLGSGLSTVTLNSDVGGVTSADAGSGTPFYGQYTTGVFTATGSTETFTYASTGAGDIPILGPINVEQLVSEVPEPSTWALLGVGLASLGMILRFRRRNS